MKETQQEERLWSLSNFFCKYLITEDFFLFSNIWIDIAFTMTRHVLSLIMSKATRTLQFILSVRLSMPLSARTEFFWAPIAPLDTCWNSYLLQYNYFNLIIMMFFFAMPFVCRENSNFPWPLQINSQKIPFPLKQGRKWLCS